MTDFDEARGNRYFSAHCFNSTWTLIEKPDRTPQENDQMVASAQASLWHWMQRPDCTPRNLSIGYWQVSRVNVLVGQASAAVHYASQCLACTPTDDAFCMGYAHEAMARAHFLAGNADEANRHLTESLSFAEKVTDPHDKGLLDADLKGLAG